MYYAHTKGKNKNDWQELASHLKNTANLAKVIAHNSALEELAEITALLHDIGKYSEAFQKRLMGSTVPVDHSTAGAQLVSQLGKENQAEEFISKLIAYCIAGHHAGLPDFGSSIDHSSEPTLSARLKRQTEDYSEYSGDFRDDNFKIPTRLPITSTRKNGQFSVSFLVRMLYSILVDADFLETESFVVGERPRGRHRSVPELNQQLNEYLKKFDHPEKAINIKRTQLLNECLSQASQDQGLFSLTIPTGGGKTYTSLAFALAHAKTHGLKRVIYCIPFTSIIDQTAKVFRDCLDDDCILEHHSNFDWQGFRQPAGNNYYDDQTNAAMEKLKLAAENWDIPIVVTTNVQFFESLFSNRSSRCRKLHSLIKSVIIFDEAQMLPRDYLEPCMMGLAELITNYKASILFCTATQPPLDKFFPDNIHQNELISHPEEIYDFFKRVTVKTIGKKTDEEISDMINSHNQALCIVNTRKHAKGLFDQINDEGKFHLSTLMCPVHREETLSDIRKRLDNGSSCRVVSTQLMEAGIDVDFPIGFRALAGLDSIVQAAGRVNRENRYPSGTVFVFKPDTTSIKRLPAYLQQTSDVAEIVLSQYEDPISIAALKAYYQLLFDLQESDAFDRKQIMGCFEKGIISEPNFDFRTASERFKLIENDTLSIIIPWNKQAKEEINKLRFSPFSTSFLRSLQPYTVNIYPHEFNALYTSGHIDIVQDRFAILVSMEKEVYHPQTGLVIPDSANGDAIFF